MSAHEPWARARLGATTRGFAAEFRRVRGDLMVWAPLSITLLSAVAVLASLPSGLRDAPSGVVAALGAVLGESFVSNLLIIAAVLGALGVARAVKSGVLPRDLAFGFDLVVIGTRAVSSVLSAVLFGALAVGVIEASFFAASGHLMISLPAALMTVVVTGSAGLWGFFIGVLVRSPILVLFVVPATLMPAVALAGVAPEVANVLPLRAQTAAAGLSQTGLPGGVAGGVLVAWLVGIAIIVAVVLRKRDWL